MVIEILINDIWTDITDKVLDSYSQTSRLSIELPKTSTLSINLEGDKAFFDFISQAHEVKVTDQDDVIYWGFANGQVSKTAIKEDLYNGSIHYYDFVKKLAGNNEVLHYTNVQIAGTENSLLELLFAQMMNITGLDLTLVNPYTDVSVIDEIYIPEGKILDNFYDFLSHNGLTFYIKAKTLYIYDMLSVPTQSWILEDCSNFKENFTFDKEESNPLVYASRVVTKEQRIFTYADSPKGELLIDGDVFPAVENEEDDDTLSCNYDIELLDNEEIIKVQDVALTQEVLNPSGENIDIDAELNATQTDCSVKLTNNSGNYVLLDNFYLDATLKVQEYFESASIKSGAVDEERSIYLRDMSHVIRYLRYVVFLNGYSKKDYSFYSDAKMALGDMVSITDLTEPMIISQIKDSQDKFGGYNYNAVLYQNAVVDAITKRIAVSKYQKGYLTEIYSNQGFVFDGSFSTDLTCRVFFGSQEVSPKTYRWYRDVGVDNDTWTKDTKKITITESDLNGKASGIFWCQTTYPITESSHKQVVDMSKNESQFLIEYCVSDNANIPSMVYLGQFGSDLYQFDDELIEVFEGAVWTTEQPQDDDKYIFIRITDGNSQTISLYSTPKAKSITLLADNSGIFSLTQRGVVKNETINITVNPVNFFIVDGDTNTEWYFYSTDWIKLTETSKTLLLQHSDFTSYPVKIKAVYNFGSKTVEATIQISEIVSTSTAVHLGVLANAPTAMGTTVPAGFAETGTLFIKGDSYVYFDGTDYFPYVFDGTSWVKIEDSEGNVPAQYSSIMIESANSVTAIGADIPATSKATYGYFRNLGAVNAFVQNFFAQNLQVGDGDGTANSGFRFRVRAYDENGIKLSNPIFDVYYGNKSVFSIDATSGNVSVGDDGSGNPLFYYDQSDNSIKSKDERFKITSEGQIIANGIQVSNGKISGLLESVGGLFTGQFETAVLKTLPGSKQSQNVIAPNTIYQAKTIVEALEVSSLDFDYNQLYKCSVVGYPEYKYISFNSETIPFGVRYEVIFSGDSSETIFTKTGIGGDSGENINNSLTITVYIGGDELYMIDLPVTQPTESNRVWRDGAYLKITT